MSAAEHAAEEPHVVLIGGRLYGSGETRQQAITDFRAQIAGGTPAMRTSMAARAIIVAVSAEHASEVAEMRDAVAIAWSDTVCRDTESTDEEDEEARFLNFYDCPCGESWSSEDDCACDDRCPTCRTSCSPTRSEDA